MGSWINGINWLMGSNLSSLTSPKLLFHTLYYYNYYNSRRSGFKTSLSMSQSDPIKQLPLFLAYSLLVLLNLTWCKCYFFDKLALAQRPNFAKLVNLALPKLPCELPMLTIFTTNCLCARLRVSRIFKKNVELSRLKCYPECYPVLVSLHVISVSVSSLGRVYFSMPTLFWHWIYVLNWPWILTLWNIYLELLPEVLIIEACKKVSSALSKILYFLIP